MNRVIACIDGVGERASGICDAASWASLRLDVPLKLLHVLDRSQYPTGTDLTGSIGLGSREALLEELADLDEKRGKLAREQGRLMLDAAREHAVADGIAEPEVLQRHGDLVETLQELEQDTRLLVFGRGGSAGETLGRNVEAVIRALHRPMLLLPDDFKAPERFLIAYDGSPTSRKAVDMVAQSPLFTGIPCDLLMIAPSTNDVKLELKQAQDKLTQAGFDVTAEILAGDVEQTLLNEVVMRRADMLVMGAYGHSRIRQMLVGSTTSNLIRQTRVPLLLLR
ncbi:universal stress protein [Marinobacterium mangrovicola]|uniref:Nucleotide-binding universal stress UspA family protein n=1 Tax=Marinobacterium mangrovicola TaxID=1476959 RepID=A0A4V2PDN4_9GAMM|nr:universal stress protein [Marinobacterium mangrovicola]TCK05896.1 nucleotide-binding universal stress UspA family protein [Marinobacterium mangrovicola]